jgi:hypothetical protein
MAIAQRSVPDDDPAPGHLFGSRLRRAYDLVVWGGPWLLPTVVIGLVMWPMASTDMSFESDWVTHLWFIEHAAETLRMRHHPSLYTNDSNSVLYPNFAFYGATAYGLFGALALLLGSARDAFVAACVLALGAAYGGWYWLGRMAGLGRWTAQLPAILAVTAPFALTIVYDRGALAEFVAVLMMPLLMASVVSVLRADRLHLAPAFALAVSIVVFFGTHNLTALWGGTVLVIAAAAVCAVAAPARSLITRDGLFRLLVVAVPALLVNAWFLVPDLAYQSQTWIVDAVARWRTLLDGTMVFVAPGSLFQLSGRGATSGNPASATIHTALPVLAIGWAAVTALLVAPRWRQAASVRVLLVLSALAVVLVVVMTHAGLILSLPEPYTMLQFSFRLESEVLLVVVGATVAGLVALRTAGGRVARWTWVLVPVVAVSLVMAVLQSDGAPRYYAVLPFYSLPGSGPHNIDYSSTKVPFGTGTKLRTLWFSPVDADASGRVTSTIAIKPGNYVLSNLAAAPDLVDVDGARVVANTVDGGTILQIDPDARAGVQTITASEAHPWPVRLGRVLSLLGLLGLAANAAVVARRSWRRRRRATLE